MNLDGEIDRPRIGAPFDVREQPRGDSQEAAELPRNMQLLRLGRGEGAVVARIYHLPGSTPRARTVEHNAHTRT